MVNWSTVFCFRHRVRVFSVFGIECFGVFRTNDHAHHVLLQCQREKGRKPATLFCECTVDFCFF